MPLGLVAALNLFLIALICVRSVRRPAAKAEQRLRRDVLGAMSSDAVVSSVSDGVIVGARADFAPDLQGLLAGVMVARSAASAASEARGGGRLLTFYVLNTCERHAACDVLIMDRLVAFVHRMPQFARVLESGRSLVKVSSLLASLRASTILHSMRIRGESAIPLRRGRGHPRRGGCAVRRGTCRRSTEARRDDGHVRFRWPAGDMHRSLGARVRPAVACPYSLQRLVGGVWRA